MVTGGRGEAARTHLDHLLNLLEHAHVAFQNKPLLVNGFGKAQLAFMQLDKVFRRLVGQTNVCLCRRRALCV